jgi:hypothetical protein
MNVTGKGGGSGELEKKKFAITRRRKVEAIRAGQTRVCFEYLVNIT